MASAKFVEAIGQILAVSENGDVRQLSESLAEVKVREKLSDLSNENGALLGGGGGEGGERLRELLVKHGQSSEVCANLATLLDTLKWKPFYHENKDVGEIQICDLIGLDGSGPLFGVSKAVNLGLMYIPSGSTFPQFGEEALVTMVVALCGSQAKIGPTQDFLKEVTLGQVVHFPSAAPKVIQSGGDAPLLAVYLRSGMIESGKSWFAGLQTGDNYSNSIMSIGNVYDYYQSFVGDYEEVMRGWGYCIPDVTGDAILKHAGLDMNALGNVEVLDLGCGDGLTGAALKMRGFEKLTGVDFSQPMLDKSAKRGIYKELKRVDLLEQLPFEDNSFDLLVSTGVTTYIKAHVLKDWARIAKPGGLIVFTHKTSVWPDWEPEQERLESEEKVWSRVWVCDPPIPYLPSLKTDGTNACQEMTKIYIYRKAN